jgi:hypothetical protein
VERSADNPITMLRTTFETGAILIDATYETELWLLSLSKFSPRHHKLLWPGFDDAVDRLARSCTIRAKA